MTKEENLAFFDFENGQWKKTVKNINGKLIFEYRFVVKFKKYFFGHCFAKIKSTNDSRWRWWKIPSKSFGNVHSEGKLEGVCKELHEAKAKALEGLPVCTSQLD